MTTFNGTTRKARLEEYVQRLAESVLIPGPKDKPRSELLRGPMVAFAKELERLFQVLEMSQAQAAASGGVYIPIGTGSGFQAGHLISLTLAGAPRLAVSTGGGKICHGWVQDVTGSGLLLGSPGPGAMVTTLPFTRGLTTAQTQLYLSRRPGYATDIDPSIDPQTNEKRQMIGWAYGLPNSDALAAVNFYPQQDMGA